MKILITTDLFTIDTNGVVTSVKNLREELVKKGHDVRVLTLSESIHSHKDGEVYYIRSMPFAVYPNVRMPLSYRHPLIKELIEWKPDVIHSQCEFFSFQYALRISKHTGAPIVHTYHTLYEQYTKYVIPSKRLGKKAVKVLSRNRLKRVSRVIVPTKKVEDTLLGYGLSASMSVIPSGISLAQHKERISEEERKAKRQELGIGEDRSVLVNLGRVGNEKNLEEVLRFFAKAVADNSKLVLLIVGDGPARESLQKLAVELGIEKDVVFTGMVNPKEVQKYYQLGDIFVSASTSETQGLTYIEAAANGLPLLCRRDLCLDDVIEEGENGYEYNNEEEFLERIEEIAGDDKWLAQAGKRSEEIAASFDKSAFGDAVEEVYKEVIHK